MELPIYDWTQAFSSWQDIPEITLVGLLPHYVAKQVGLPTMERKVLIHRKTVEHIHERRVGSSRLAQ
jgi:hypothetical protein